MNYKILLVFFIIVSCSTYDTSLENKKILFEKSFINSGFTLVYDDKLQKSKKISKKLDASSLIVFQKNLEKGTFVKVTNLLNDKSLVATVGINANYPNFYNSVVSKRIARDLDINVEEPYIEIRSINDNSTFVANKAKTYDEEKNVADKAPVEGITIKTIGTSNSKKSKGNKIKEDFNYIIKIADFYYIDSAKSLNNRIKSELKINNAKIKKLSKTKFRLYLGPFKKINQLKKTFIKIEKLEFENIEILKI